MNIPYGFDCYTFGQNEVKYFESNLLQTKWADYVPFKPNLSADKFHECYNDEKSGQVLPGFVRFTRKNEYYPREQVNDLVRIDKLNKTEVAEGKQIFCGIKIQIGIGIVTNFLRKGLQYRKPNKGRSELVNGTWTGIVSGLTVDKNAANSYDIAFGNFLAYDEEFPYMKFGPFIAVESKLVMLTGSSRSIEASSFGTNINSQVWLAILAAMIILSIVASVCLHWEQTKPSAVRSAIRHLSGDRVDQVSANVNHLKVDESLRQRGVGSLVLQFFFIYFTMLLNKPCVEFDDLIWKKRHRPMKPNTQYSRSHTSGWYRVPQMSIELNNLRSQNKAPHNQQKKCNRTGRVLPTSIRIVSYLWSAACLVMASIYSGEMLAVILLRADQNVDTILQLISAKPPIEPVIRQDDFTYNLMLKSLDKNMLILHNLTKIVPRPEVYTRHFIESVSERKQALLGDDELIETIYDIYHKYFPLHKSQVTYLQYPISIMYRLDFNKTMEAQMRRGVVQIFEMGLTHRWYQAQKETYIHFYDTYEKKDHVAKDKDLADLTAAKQYNYKPLTMQNFGSFLKFMMLCMVLAFFVLALEIIHNHLTDLVTT